MGTLKHPERLAGVDQALSNIIVAAVITLPFDCVVSEGLRSKAQAIINYRKGRTAAQLLAVGIKDPPLPGPQVTWTLKSKHVDGLAVDVYPLMSDGSLDRGKSAHGMQWFDALYHAVMAEAARQKVRIRYGGDWDQDGALREKGETDSPHFERA